MVYKESLRDKVIKHWFGISGNFDEYKHQEVNRIGTNAFMLYLPIIFVSILASLFIVAQQPENAVLLIIIIQLGYFMLIICPYIMTASRRSHLTDNEVDEKNISKAYLTVGRKLLFTWIYLGILFYLQKVLINAYFDGTNLIHTLTQWSYIRTGLLGGAFVSIILSIQDVARIKKYW